MEEQNILSREEVDALIKSAQAASVLAADTEESPEGLSSNINTNALEQITEQIRQGIETKLTVLMRKKIIVKVKPAEVTNLAECIKSANESHAYTSMKIMPYHSAAMVVTEHLFLDASLNLLYGGKIKTKDNAPAKLGKIGLITAEKISLLIMECVADAVKEYAVVTSEVYKNSHNIQNVINLPDEPIYVVNFTVLFDDTETGLTIFLSEEFLIKLIPLKTGKGKHKERDFWRTAIKGEVLDSFVVINTTMTDNKISLKDFMQLKEGYEIPIDDPTVVFVCLNELKLFRALAGQSNSKLVVKIVSQV